jgi:hypothetical protein
MSTVLFVIAAGLITIGWFGLVSRIERSGATERERTRIVLLTCALWFAPVLIGPPLLSSDIYSYAAQGEMVTRGLDPTSQGMHRLLSGDYVARVDPIWRRPDPGKPEFGNGYGPVQMGVAAGVVYATGHDAGLTLWGLRIVALGGIALAGWGILQIARHHGLDPPTSLALAIGNPIVVLHLIGGAHNDALLIGLLAAGIALMLRDRWWWGVTLLAMAASVKLPAAAAIPMMAWSRPGVGPALRDRVRSVATAFAAAFGVVLAATVVVGVSFGWIDSMRNAGATKGTLAVTTQLGFLTSGALTAVGAPTSSDLWIGVFRLLGIVAAGAFSLWLLNRSHRIGPVLATGLCLLAVVLLGPVVWPWYFGPALMVLFAVDLGRWRVSAMVLCAAFAVEVFPSAPGGTVPDGNHLGALLTIIGIGALALALPFVPGWWQAVRGERSSELV